MLAENLENWAKQEQSEGDYLEQAEGEVATANAALATDRAENIATGAIANVDLIEDFDGARATDARLQQLVDAAQAAVRAEAVEYDADGVVYDDATSTSGPFTARQLQSQLNAANSTLAGDVARNGETLTIASTLSDAIGAFLAQNADLAGGELQAVRNAYVAVVAEIEAGGDGSVALPAWVTAVDSAIEEGFDADATDRSSVLRANADEDLSAGIVDGLLALNTRFANEERVEAREDAFGDTASGADLVIALELQADRQELIDDLTEAQELVETLQTLLAEYEDAVAAVEAASDALGFEVVNVDDGIIFGVEDEAELFIFNADDLDEAGIVDITLNDLEAGDALFFGSSYQLGGETGDNNALEFFVTTNVAGDVVIEVENAVFGSVQDDSYSVTLTGISEDQLNIDGGVISIVEVA